jgi:hypothetical protein
MPYCALCQAQVYYQALALLYRFIIKRLLCCGAARFFPYFALAVKQKVLCTRNVYVAAANVARNPRQVELLHVLPK